MSLPNYLAKIKSAGIYRFVWDKSVVPPQQAETLRLLVGYSEKGPFNTPVYIETVSDFRAIFGNISKRLERKGVYFHRMAEQALTSGPILALNLKPFGEETVDFTVFNGSGIEDGGLSVAKIAVTKLYDTKRLWKLDENQLPAAIESTDGKPKGYFNIAMTDSKDSSCSIFVHKSKPESYSGITFRSWYASQGIEYPEYMESILDEQIDEFFADIYVFKGQFTETVCAGSLKEYFSELYREAKDDEEATHYKKDDKYYKIDSDYKEGDATYIFQPKLKTNYTNKLGQEIPILDALASDPNSNFVGVYSGCTVPYFKDANSNYISLDVKFNADNAKHKMMMKMNDIYLEDLDDGLTVKDVMSIAKSTEVPTYLTGYDYVTVKSDSTSGSVWSQCKKMISNVSKSNKSVCAGMIEALTNRVDVEYHYIIDTFDSDTTENKVELFTLAKLKDNAFAIVNFPKMSKFDNVESIKATFPMPSEIDGASYGAYYTQLTFSDGVIKTVVPSTALVSNLFMTKWTTRQPYYIVAGPNFSTLNYSGLVGPDYNFSRKDLDILEPMGINAIIYVPRLGTYISSNQTAKQVPVSGLSKVHIRELVIYLQNEVEHLLQSYQWELNTQPLRDTIKAKADAICDTIKNNGGIYEFINICDETNNTPEVIDNEMIILDTEIEPARGAGKMVHQLTIHKTGGLTSLIK